MITRTRCLQLAAITVPKFTNQWMDKEIRIFFPDAQMAQNWLVVCTSDGSPFKDATNQPDNSEVNTIKCIGVSTAPQKQHTLFFAKFLP